jgi:hypothetical protein
MLLGKAKSEIETTSRLDRLRSNSAWSRTGFDLRGVLKFSMGWARLEGTHDGAPPSGDLQLSDSLRHVSRRRMDVNAMVMSY